jgi:hypothetical protein
MGRENYEGSRKRPLARETVRTAPIANPAELDYFAPR